MIFNNVNKLKIEVNKLEEKLKQLEEQIEQIEKSLPLIKDDVLNTLEEGSNKIYKIADAVIECQIDDIETKILKKIINSNILDLQIKRDKE